MQSGDLKTKHLALSPPSGLFTLLGTKALSGKEIKEKLGFNTTDRHVFDWLDALVSLGLLQPTGLWDSTVYSNADDTEEGLRTGRQHRHL